MFDKTFERDRFYPNLNKNEIIWIHREPDSFGEDQFILNTFTEDLFSEATEKYDQPDEVFYMIGAKGKQYCVDINDLTYEVAKKRFASEPFTVGICADTIDALESLFVAKYAIELFHLETLGSPADFSDLRKVLLVRKSIRNNTHKIQIYANLVDCCTEYVCDGTTITCENAKTLAEYALYLALFDLDDLMESIEKDIDKYESLGLLQKSKKR